MMNERYDILTFRYTPPGHIVLYFERLEDEGLLRERFTDTDSPTLETTIQLLQKNGERFFFVWDKERETIVGEFAISDTISEVGIVHFSMSPDVIGHEVFHIIREGTNEVLQKWTKQDSEEPFVKALVGLTPVENRTACLVIQRCGFKKIAVVPYAGRYNGRVCDAILTVKQRSVNAN